MTTTFPKILIFSQTFNTISGGGITLTNLFASWPKDKIAVVSYPFMLNHITTDICNTYYQLGFQELKWAFPFSLVKERQESGPIIQTKEDSELYHVKRNTIRSRISSRLINPFLNWLNITHIMSNLSISTRFNEWLLEYEPELLYFQISNRESINFASALVDHLEVPAVIHMMDDWPSTLCRNGVSKFLWAKKIDSEFRLLLSKLSLHLAICDEMSSEYYKRYGYRFSSFHNTIDLKTWTPFTKNNLTLSTGTKVVLFSGRVGPGIEQSLFDLAEAIDLLRLEGIDIILQIQSPRGNTNILNKINRYSSVKINPPIDYDKLPELYSKADVLIIANDFHPDGIRFLKYSMPTKAPEYMISGTPILIYASAETALYKFFHHNNCGHCVAKRNITELANAFRLLLHDINYRKILSRNAVAYAIEHFDSDKVRQDFQSQLCDTVR